MRTKLTLIAMVIGTACWGWNGVRADPPSEAPATRPADGEREGRRGPDDRVRPGRGAGEGSPLGGPRMRSELDDDDSPRHGRFRGRDDRGPMMPPRPDGDVSDEPLSEAEIDRIMENAREHFPELHERLEKLRERDPETFQGYLQRARGPLAAMVRQEGRPRPDGPPRGGSRPMFRLEIELRGLARRYHGASTDEDRETIRDEMKERLTRQVEMRLDDLRREIEDAEERLRQAREDLAEREANKDDFVAERLEKLLTEPDGDDFARERGLRRFRDEPGRPRGREDAAPPPRPRGEQEPPRSRPPPRERERSKDSDR